VVDPFENECNPSVRILQEKTVGSFLTFLGKAVVHEQNSDTWEFGKGALSANVYFFGNHYQAIGAAANPVMG
jgi:hypothetical protein